MSGAVSRKRPAEDLAASKLRKLALGSTKVYVPIQPQGSEARSDLEEAGRKAFSVRFPNSAPHTVRARRTEVEDLKQAVGDAFDVDIRKFRFLGAGKPLSSGRSLDAGVP